MDKKLIGNVLFQVGSFIGVVYSCFGMNNTILGLVFLMLQIGMNFMNWDDQNKGVVVCYST